MGWFPCALILPLICLFSGALSQEKLTVSVYYETLCPDSIRFITTQLYPAFKRLGGNTNSYFNIDFVPYGKATTRGENGNFIFHCQHGSRECEGNKMHACALKHLPAESQAAFINCSMDSYDPPSAGPSCASHLGLDFKIVEQCLNSTEGSTLLAANGDRTHNLDPTLNYVPWILYNGQFNTSDLSESQRDFSGLLCKKLGRNGPRDCPGNLANITVSVFYETLCPDSIRFITTQLYPTFLSFGGHGNPYFDIDFVPYGKANTTEGPNGNFTFQCQHGDQECEGNRVHACALKYYPESSVEAFVNCTMSSRIPPEAGPACAQTLELDFAPIQTCIRTEGSTLLAANGNRTHSLNPPLYFVPWITFNGNSTEYDQELSQSNFKVVICYKLGTSAPTSCKKLADKHRRE